MADRIIYSLASLILNVFLYGFIGYIIYKIKKSRKKIKALKEIVDDYSIGTSIDSFTNKRTIKAHEQ
jgi:hypothetical protein